MAKVTVADRDSLSRSICALVSIYLHAGLIALFSLSPTTPVATDTEMASSDRPPLVATFIEIEEHTGDKSVDLFFRDGSARIGTTSIDLLTLRMPDLAPIAEEYFVEGEQITDASDAETFQKLQSLYVSQVSARIARVIEMSLPNAGVALAQLQCPVHIIQSDRGEVVDVDMEDCEVDSQQKARIAAAVYAASPLPLPPEGLAMGSYITLQATAWH